MDQKISEINLPCLLYDEECPLCLRFKQSLERINLTEKIYFYPIQNKRIYRELPFLNSEDTKKEVHIIMTNKEVITGTDVVSYLAKLNPKVHKFSWLLESKVGEKALDIFYKTTNKYRKSLRKCCQKCNH